MNLAFLLSSFGVKLTEQDIANITRTLQNAPAMIADFVARFQEMELRNMEMHAALMKLAGDKPLDPVEREFRRQLVIFPPAPEGMTHSPEFLERMQRNVGHGSNGDSENRDAGNVLTGGQQFN